MMAEVQNSGYLSIGEVLGMLLEEFPDITISKIRFLESQGLISPERTASGYRKFYDDDVELLRVILTEQRENYLPLRVIKDRLETGEIDPTGEHLRPNGADDDDTDGADRPDRADDPELAEHGERADGRADVPSTSIRSHPAAGANGGNHGSNGHAALFDQDTSAGEPGDSGDTVDARLLPGVLLDRGELCSMVGISDAELSELESFGIVSARPGAGIALYGEDAVEIARPAAAFLRLGIDARHLRAWRTAADREASLYEQLVAPKFRQRNPKARADAVDLLRQLDGLGGVLREAMTRNALRHHFDG